MLWSKLTWAAALLPSLAMANFASDCNPTEASCSADPALGGSVKLDFSKKTDLFTNLYGEDRTNYTSSGLVQWFQNHGDGPSLRSNFYIQYGKLEIKCKIPKGTGIIANFFLQSDDGDEIDFEWMSSYPKQVTTNYFGKGVTGSYDRGTVKATDSNLAEEYHTYTIDWQKDQTIWYMDGTAIRTLKADSVATDGAHDYPDSPMRVFIGMWAGGDSEYTDTVNWAGGKTTLEGVPFIYNVEYFAAVDYSSGSSYYYKDKTGNSIGSNGGSVNANSKASLPAAFTTPAWGSSSSSTASSSSATSSASKSSSSASSSSSKSSSNASSSSASSKASSSASSTVSSTAASSSKSVSTTATVTSSAHKKDASSSAASTSKSSVVHYQNTTVSSGPSTVTDVVSHVSTKLATITSCKDNACHTTVQTSLVTYPSTSVHVANSTILSTSKWSSTIYSTYTTHFPTLSTATVVDSHISTDVVTITSCQNNACQTHTSNVPKTEVVTRETHVNVTQVVTSVVTVGTTQVNTPPPAETTTATPVSSSTEVASSSSSSSSATTTSATAAAAESTSSTSVAPSSTAAASGTTIADTTSGTVVVATSAPSTTVINGETSGVSFVVSSSDSTIFTVATSYISLTHYSTKTVHHKHQSASTQSLVASSAAAIYSAATGNGTNNISTYSIPNNDTLLSSNAGSLLYSPKAGFTGVALIMIVIALL